MAEYKEIEEADQDPVNYIIVISGIVVGILLLIGFITTLMAVFNWNIHVRKTKPDPIVIINSSPDTETQPINVIEQAGNSQQSQSGSATYLISLRDNGIRQTINVPDTFILELPSSLYPQSGLVVTSDPQDSFQVVGPTDPSQSGNWALIIKVTTKGIGDIIVPAANKRYSDFHVAFTIK